MDDLRKVLKEELKPVLEQLGRQGKQLGRQGKQLGHQGKQLEHQRKQLGRQGKLLAALDRNTGANGEAAGRNAYAVLDSGRYWPGLELNDGELRAGASPISRQQLHALPCACLLGCAPCMHMQHAHISLVCMLCRHVGCLHALFFDPVHANVVKHAAPLPLTVQRTAWWPLRAARARASLPTWAQCWTRCLQGTAATFPCETCCCSGWR